MPCIVLYCCLQVPMHLVVDTLQVCISWIGTPGHLLPQCAVAWPWLACQNSLTSHMAAFWFVIQSCLH
jgi:hypothetical protein